MKSFDYPSLSVSVEDNLLLIGLDRPEKRNAINDELVLNLEKVFDSIPSSIGCVILYGSGKHFSAGLDLSALEERDIVQGVQHSRMWHRIMNKIQFSQVPVVAVLHGAVVGGGLELASACHIRIAEPTTFYALPEGQRGIFVGGGGSVRLPKLVGLGVLTDMILTGRVYKGQEAEHLGFAQYQAAEGEGMVKAKELARKISSNAGMTNFAITHILPRIAEASHEQGLALESLIAGVAQSAPEAKERLRDFLEGRAKKVGE